jgi:hypothetical protein
MGLDMYLSAKKHISNDDQVKVEGLPEAAFLKLKGVTYEGMYWRKANAIHAWFVENVQNGVDDCGEYEVETEQLAALMNVCADVIADPERAKELLPPQGGFFFGAAEVDDWYWDDVKRTYEELKQLLLALDSGDWWTFTYRSSW